MEFHTTKTNTLKFIETEIIGELKNWFALLVEGKLYDYETELQQKLIGLCQKKD